MSSRPRLSAGSARGISRSSPGLMATAVVAALMPACAGPVAPARPSPQPAAWIEGEPIYEVLPPDAIPAIDEPTFVDATLADAFLAPDEPVLGIVGEDGTAKCYSAWHLEGHEIVNDELDGRAIAVTW